MHGLAAIIIGLGLADVAVAVDGWRRVSRRLGWKRLGLAGGGRGWWGRPDRALGRQVASYGLRGQVGGLITLLNLRLDFAVLGAMAGPAVLGAYAVASKYAELLRLPGHRADLGLLPTAGQLGRVRPRPRHGGWSGRPCSACWSRPCRSCCSPAPVIGPVLRRSFASAVQPAQVLVVGMLLGRGRRGRQRLPLRAGRPGLNSVVLGVGLVVT